MCNLLYCLLAALIVWFKSIVSSILWRYKTAEKGSIHTVLVLYFTNAFKACSFCYQLIKYIANLLPRHALHLAAYLSWDRQPVSPFSHFSHLKWITALNTSHEVQWCLFCCNETRWTRSERPHPTSEELSWRNTVSHLLFLMPIWFVLPSFFLNGA